VTVAFFFLHPSVKINKTILKGIQMITQENKNLPRFVTLTQSTFPETFMDIRMKINFYFTTIFRDFQWQHNANLIITE